MSALFALFLKFNLHQRTYNISASSLCRFCNFIRTKRASDQDKAASCQRVGVVCLAALKNKLFPMDYVPGFLNVSFGTLF